MIDEIDSEHMRPVKAGRSVISLQIVGILWRAVSVAQRLGVGIVSGQKRAAGETFPDGYSQRVVVGRESILQTINWAVSQVRSNLIRRLSVASRYDISRYDSVRTLGLLGRGVLSISAPNFTIWPADHVRANRVCNGRTGLANKDLRTNGLVWIQDSCFTQPAANYFGTSGFDILTGPGLNNWDIGIHKSFPIREATRIDFRAEFFNAWNHAQFANPNGSVVASAFGQVSSTQHAPREVQLGLRLSF